MLSKAQIIRRISILLDEYDPALDKVIAPLICVTNKDRILKKIRQAQKIKKTHLTMLTQFLSGATERDCLIGELLEEGNIEKEKMGNKTTYFYVKG